MMKILTTLTGKKFQYHDTPYNELIIYPSDKNGELQEKFALIITSYTINFVKTAIKQKRNILMGASRDNPPQDSLGGLLKSIEQTPQQLSYLVPILIESGFCDYIKDGKAFIVKYKGG